MCSSIIVRQDTAMVGFYAVKHEFQGRGIGKDLWYKTLSRFDNYTFNLSLFAVPKMVKAYSKLGFTITDNISMCVLERECLEENEDGWETIEEQPDIYVKNNSDSYNINFIYSKCENKELIDKICNFDTNITGQLRKRFYEYYLRNVMSINKDEQEDTIPLTVVITDDSTNVVAYGCRRNDNTGGATLGPIYANSNELCQMLIVNLLKGYKLRKGTLLSAMTLTCTPYARDLLVEKYSFKEIDRCPRLFTKFVPEADLCKIFCLFSPNFSLF